jgi:hypothetical protein
MGERPRRDRAAALPTGIGALSTLIGVAGRRWAIDESIQAGMGLTGLDEHQLRRLGFIASLRRTTIPRNADRCAANSSGCLPICD